MGWWRLVHGGDGALTDWQAVPSLAARLDCGGAFFDDLDSIRNSNSPTPEYKDLEIEFIERAVKEVKADVATLANQTEIEKDQRKPDIKVDPTQIRIRHASTRLDEKYYMVRVWLDAPPEFMQQVKKVIYQRHETFRQRLKEVSTPPFEDSFRCWGEFTIKAESS